MRQRLRNLAKNDFLRNVTTLAAGTIISQIVVVAVSPLLSRLFTVEDFGALSIFTSFTVFLAVVSTGRYEFAIGLPEDDNQAKKIVKLIFCIGAYVSVFYFLAIIVLREVLKINDPTGFLSYKEAYIAPFYILCIAIYSALSYWNQRYKRYKSITIANSLQVISTAFSSIVFGLLGLHSGMIWALLVGIVAAIFYFVLRDTTIFSQVLKQKEIKQVAIHYSSFPRYMIFSDLSLSASQQFIPIVFSVFYGATVVGLFSMANRMLRLPNIIITSAIGNVFRNDAIDSFRERGNCTSLYWSTFKKLIAMSFPIYFLLFILSPWLFEFVFGPEWYEAGVYARIICVFLFFEFVASPLNSLFYIRDRQKLFMMLQVFNTFFGGVGIYMGYRFCNNPYYSLMFFSASSIIFNIIFLWKTKKLSNEE
ncbi:colanic acid exporter [Chryseobacterium taklimakanense]|uniref:Colanic acid exporter n=1 Tax=Chryseobacterium taklimakanense TaxID=536441 RepID=A0A239X6W9_9FLAO|nr:oligosaccharide flippase family protein [Chryseobacterium taklimakanense]SNV42455.1 colanic acid exporter [Chryseobacterium taklimakanense]